MVGYWWRGAAERAIGSIARKWAEFAAASSSASGARAIHRTGGDAITDERVAALAAILRRPQHYVQRIVEEMEFLPTGGQLWTRTIQLEIPGPHSAPEDWYVVSLGSFTRQRFPDISVQDASGRRVNLVTREEHGEILTLAILTGHLRIYKRKVAAAETRERSSEITGPLTALKSSASKIVTDLEESSRLALAAEVDTAVHAFACLTGVRTDSKHANALRSALTDASATTRYLCWVRGTPGEIVNLRAVYTTADVWAAISERDGLIRWVRDQWAAYRCVRGWLEPRRKPVPEVERMRLYRLLGLAPINYEFKTPGHRHARSYYFTLKPPPNTSILRVIGCGEAVHTEGELNCAHKSVHTHNGSRATPFHEPPEGDTTVAYLRPHSRDHKVMIGGAVLNLLFVYFVARGRFVTGTGLTAQSWLLLTPTVLVGLIAQRQRHYYALATHLQRGVLWTYLGISVLFLITVAFSTAYRDGEWGPKALAVFVAFSATSAGLAAFYLPLGHRYQRALSKATHRGRNAPEGLERAVTVYGLLVQKYCDGTMKLTGAAILTVVSVAAAMIVGGYVKVGTPTPTKPLIEMKGPLIQVEGEARSTTTARATP